MLLSKSLVKKSRNSTLTRPELIDRRSVRNSHHRADGYRTGKGLSMMTTVTTIHASGYADGAMWSGQKLFQAAHQNSARMK